MRLIPNPQALEALAGVEESLRVNKRLKDLSLGTVVLLLIPQVANATVAWLLDQGSLVISESALIATCVAAAVLLVTRHFFRTPEAPLGYTCSLESFTPLNEGAKSLSDFSVEISHDLAELLHQRIGRLHFTEQRPSGDDGISHSHIHITGEFLIRTESDEDVMLEVTPKLSVGSEGAPFSLAHPVKYPVEESSDGFRLSRSQHVDVLERTYFSIASHIYAEIRQDIERKIRLLPTAFMKATAYLREAEDYARSNTMDAYAVSLHLYEKAIRLYDPRLVQLPRPPIRRPVKYLSQKLTSLAVWIRRRLALMWPSVAKREVFAAQAEVGYASALLYQRILAGLSGHRLNPIYPARPALHSAILRLKKLPSQVPQQSDTLFKAHVGLALAWISFGSVTKARKALAKAREFAPSTFESNANYLYVAGVLQPELRPSLNLLSRAVERAPRFEVARFELAHRYEMEWRIRDLDPVVATSIVDRYEDVLKINPSNLRAWANIGYVHWLLGQLPESIQTYERGLEYKSIKNDVHVPDLNYGKARVEAELGRIVDAYWSYRAGADAQLAEGVSFASSHSAQHHPFSFINERMIKRYSAYLERVKENLGERDVIDRANREEGDRNTPRVRSSVKAFVLNDFGEACYTLHRRNGSATMLKRGLSSYKEATKANPNYVMPFYNLFLLHMGAGKLELAVKCLNRVRELEPAWTDATVARAYALAQWIATQPGSLKERKERAKEMKSAIEEVKELVPHPWLWKRGHKRGKKDRPHEESATPNWRAISNREFRRTRKWEREMDDVHVTALFSWSLGNLAAGKEASGRLSALRNREERQPTDSRSSPNKPRKLLEHIRDRLWPSDFLVLLFLRRFFGDTTVDDDLQDLVEIWLKKDPTAHWALSIAIQEFEDEKGNTFRIVGGDKGREYLERALDNTKTNSAQHKKLKQMLEESRETSAEYSTLRLADAVGNTSVQ